MLVIGGDEDVSSYALMPGLAGGLVWISSIGVDMVARGIPVLAAARPKYHALGLVEEPPTSPELLRRPAPAGRGAPPRPTPEQQARARQYLDVVFSAVLVRGVQPLVPGARPLPDRPGSPPDADVFYRIVAGDLPPETPPRREADQVA